MTTLTRKQLIHLPVVTRSDQAIGTVVDFEIDAETQTVWRYEIAQGDILIPGFFGKKFFVAPSQVISLDAKKMVVEDAVVKDAQLAERLVS